MARKQDPNNISDITKRLMQDLEVKRLMQDLEAQMYYGMPKPTYKLLKLLQKLNIKSAYEAQAGRGHGALNVEPLDAILKSVTFDMSHLEKWPKPK